MAVDYELNIRKLYLFKFLFSLFFISPVLIPFFTDWGGLSFFQIMILQSWFMLWSFILEIPTGAIADKIGRKACLVIGAFFGVAWVLVYASYPNFYVFLVGEFMAAVASALFSGTEEAFVYDSLKKKGDEVSSKLVFGRLRSAFLVGLLISTLTGSFIAARFGLRATLLAMTIPFAAGFLLSFLFNEPKIVKRPAKYFEVLKGGVNYFLRSKVLRILALDMIVLMSIGYFIIWLYQPMLKQAGIELAYFGVVHFAFVTSQLLILNNFVFLERMLGSKGRVVFFSAILTGLMFILGGISSFIPFVLISIIVGGGFGLAREVLMISYINKHIPSSRRATVNSTISAFRRLALVILNPIVGLLVTWSLNYTLIILGAVAIVFSLFSRIEESHLVD